MILEKSKSLKKNLIRLLKSFAEEFTQEFSQPKENFLLLDAAQMEDLASKNMRAIPIFTRRASQRVLKRSKVKMLLMYRVVTII